MDDSLNGKISAPSIGFFDFVVKEENKLPSNMSQSITLQQIKSTSSPADNFILAQRGINKKEYKKFYAHLEDPPIKPEWFGGVASLDINRLEQQLVHKAISSSAFYSHLVDHSPSEHFAHSDPSDTTQQEILALLRDA